MIAAPRSAVLAAACPTGVTTFLVAGRFRTGEGLASNTITISTILAVATVTAWLTLVEAIQQAVGKISETRHKGD